MHRSLREAETGPRIGMADHPVRVEPSGLALAKFCLAAAEIGDTIGANLEKP